MKTPWIIITILFQYIICNSLIASEIIPQDILNDPDIFENREKLYPYLQSDTSRDLDNNIIKGYEKKYLSYPIIFSSLLVLHKEEYFNSHDFSDKKENFTLSNLTLHENNNTKETVSAEKIYIKTKEFLNQIVSENNEVNSSHKVISLFINTSLFSSENINLLKKKYPLSCCYFHVTLGLIR